MTLITIPNRPSGSTVRSIEQILADFDAITDVVNGGLDRLTNITPGAGVAKGAITGTGLFPPTNTPTLITGLSIVTAAILSGEDLLVWLNLFCTPSSNSVGGYLTLNGTSEGAGMETTITNTLTQAYYFSGLTGTQTLAGWGSASSSVGGINGSIIYMIC
jgi:hypothetical protein